MKVLYLECNMGAAGDMLMAALLELTDDREGFIERINHIGLPNVKIKAYPEKKQGITGTHISVTVNGEKEEEHVGEHYHGDNNCHYEESHHHGKEHIHEYNHHHGGEHHHHSLSEIYGIIDGLTVEENVKEHVKNIYKMIAEAESRAHGTEVSQIHFHEVGMADAIADITGCSMLMNQIGADRVIVSPVKTGYGTVRCAHGVMPVPAPATAFLLQGIPTLSGNIEGELCTPTGAAVIKYFGDEFKYQPEMVVEKTGYGMGTKEFEQANCVRAMLGKCEEKNSDKDEALCVENLKNMTEERDYRDTVVELKCNLDDMTPEEIGFATEMLRSGKALDVYTSPISMKKSRTGTLLCVLCRERDEENVVGDIFKYTSTIGIRKYVCERFILKRETEIRETDLGKVKIKKSSGYGVMREKPEYEDLRRIAKEQGTGVGSIKLKDA